MPRTFNKATAWLLAIKELQIFPKSNGSRRSGTVSNDDLISTKMAAGMFAAAAARKKVREIRVVVSD